MNIHEILSHFNNAKDIGGGQYRANCPNCGDTGRHLYIKDVGDRAIINCKKNCDWQDVLFSARLEKKDLFYNPKGKSAWTLLREHIYHDKDGNIIAKKMIYDKGGGDKAATWNRYESGKYVINLKEKPPLYRLQHVMAERDTVYIAEGEKDADTLVKMGLCGTTSPNGAGSRWSEKYNKYLKSKNVIILADNDEVGDRHASSVAISLTGLVDGAMKEAVKPVKVIRATDIMPDVKPKGDITDIADKVGIDQAKTLLLAAIERAEPYTKHTPVPVSAAELLPPEFTGIGKEPYSVNDIGLSYLFADTFKSKARYCPERGMWFIYDGKRWAADTGGLQADELAKDFQKMLLKSTANVTDHETSKKIGDFAQKLWGRHKREALLKDAKSVHPLYCHALDTDTYSLNCQNGTLDLRTGILKPHNSDDMLTKITKVNYDPTAKCERWNTFIDEIMQGDKSRAKFIQKALGYALTGDTSQECLFILWGKTTRNGKSTIMTPFMELMGDYGRATRPESIAVRQNNDSRSASEDIARLAGIRFCNISEPDKKLNLSTSLVKTLTGNDPINARYLHENSFDFIPQFKMFINTNHLPVCTDDTIFSSGRIKLIPFERHFTAAEQDKTLKDKFTTPQALSGILNWCLYGLAKYMIEGLIPPQSVTEATDMYKRKSDKVGQFMDECLVPEVGSKISGSDVYDAYVAWCKTAGIYPQGRGNFYEELKSKGVYLREIGKIGGKTVRNIIEDCFLNFETEFNYNF